MDFFVSTLGISFNPRSGAPSKSFSSPKHYPPVQRSANKIMSNDGESEQFDKDYLLQFRRVRLDKKIEHELFRRALFSTHAHVKMLGETGIITDESSARLLEAVDSITQLLRSGEDLMQPADADVYAALERLLRDRVGEEFILARTAKSHNDQAATDLRLWLRDSVLEIADRILTLRRVFLEMAQRDIDTVMPGYTHMQPAEAILLSHWWLAGEARFCRDYSRLTDFYKRLNMLPLGANVLAGTREPIDRRMVAISLGFDDVIENSLDAVTDRDFLIEFGAFASIVGVHLSQMGGELLLWVTQEFAFARIPLNMMIESHTLQLRRNPEILEVLRARPSLIFGRLMEFLTQLKGLTIGFSQDLQECVPGLFEIVESLKIMLDLAIGMLPGLEFDQNRMREVACADLVNVSNALDYLLTHGVEREIAGRAVEHLAHYCRTRHKYLSDLALNEWQQYSPAFEADIYDYIAMEESVGAFCSYGGSSKGQVEMAMARTKGHLQKDMAQLAELVTKSTSSLSRQASAPPK